VRFFGSTDGISFIPLTMTPFASGTGVQSATANGNWFIPTQNYLVVKAVFTRLTGTVLVTMSVAQDSSYQDAFLATNTIYQNSVATAATNTLTIAAQANRAWRLRKLVVTVLGGTVTWAAQPVLTIKDGSTLLWALDLATTNGAFYDIPLPPETTPIYPGGGLVNTPGNTLVIAVASGGASVQTNINAALSAA
jgi:hypothetical protein